jgi:AcrR family transcriptional regulator
MSGAKSARSTTPLRADAARNRARVLEAARAALLDGDNSLAANALAHRAGVGVGTVYRHFPDRQSLVEALTQKSFTTLVNAALAAAQKPDPNAALDILLRAVVRGMDRDPLLVEVLLVKRLSGGEMTGLAEKLLEAGDAIISRARKSGVLRDDLDFADMYRLLVGIHLAGQLDGATPTRRTRYLDVLIAGLHPDSD